MTACKAWQLGCLSGSIVVPRLAQAHGPTTKIPETPLVPNLWGGHQMLRMKRRIKRNPMPSSPANPVVQPMTMPNQIAPTAPTNAIPAAPSVPGLHPARQSALSMATIGRKNIWFGPTGPVHVWEDLGCRDLSNWPVAVRLKSAPGGTLYVNNIDQYMDAHARKRFVEGRPYDPVYVSTNEYNILYGPAITAPTVAPVPVMKAFGCNCKKCNMKNEFAEPNQKDGTYVCYMCR